jgi:hypothetical protein
LHGLDHLPLLSKVLALHGRTLLRLSGVPLRLAARVSRKKRPALDLSGLRLTKLGVDCSEQRDMVPDEHAWDKQNWMWPERLPGALEELELLGIYMLDWQEKLACAPRSGARLAGRLPRLHTLRLTSSDNHALLSAEDIPLLNGFSSPPHFQANTIGLESDIGVGTKVLDRVRSVRIRAGNSRVFLRDDQEDGAMVVERLCRLEAAELHAERCSIGVGPDDGRLTRVSAREMVGRRGDCFAVDVGVIATPYYGGYDHKARLYRLAWRRWPAPGAPDLPAASRA